MSGEAFALIRTIRVGARYTVTFSVPAGEVGDIVGAFVEWSPLRNRPLTDAELRDFRAGRDDMLSELARVTRREVEALRERRAIKSSPPAGMPAF